MAFRRFRRGFRRKGRNSTEVTWIGQTAFLFDPEGNCCTPNFFLEECQPAVQIQLVGPSEMAKFERGCSVLAVKGWSWFTGSVPGTIEHQVVHEQILKVTVDVDFPTATSPVFPQSKDSLETDILWRRTQILDNAAFITNPVFNRNFVPIANLNDNQGGNGILLKSGRRLTEGGEQLVYTAALNGLHRGSAGCEDPHLAIAMGWVEFRILVRH